MIARSRLESSCELVEKPLADGAPIKVHDYELPPPYRAVLRIANGFVLEQSAFRFFGVRPGEEGLDVNEWNESAWIAEYGALAKGLVFFAEDVFGDQYAFRYGRKGARPALVKFWCEGGLVEEVQASSLDGWLESLLSREEPSVDWGLATEAFEHGLRPTFLDHLSFVLPLIAGGSDELGNLEVLERGFHLHLLGQMSIHNQSQPNGTPIKGFLPKD